MSTPETTGGKEGGEARKRDGGPDHLTRSEMKLLENHIRKEGKFCLGELTHKNVPEEMELLATCAESVRDRIAAAKVLVAMKQVNLEIEKRESGAEPASSTTNNTQVNLHVGNITGTEICNRIAAALDALAANGVRGDVPAGVARVAGDGVADGVPNALGAESRAADAGAKDAGG